MAGLLNQQSQQQPGAAPQQQPAPAGDGPGIQAQGDPQAEANVSPEEQQQYDMFVTNGMNLMYSEQVLPQVMDSLEGAGNPIAGLANTTAMIVMRLEDSADEQGREFGGDVKLHAAQELMGQLADLAAEGGIHDFSPEELETSFFMALDLYRTTRQEQGKLDQDQYKQDLAQLQQAEQQGQLDEILPGIIDYAKQAPSPEQLAELQAQAQSQARQRGQGQGGQPPQQGA